MITFEKLTEVNTRVAKVEIKGKMYACVPARIQAFREMCPDGSITTEIVYMNDGEVVIKATVTDENGKVLATGIASEKESSSFINKTSYIENCETSAVGRALGMIGIGSESQMASAEELANAIMNQNEKPKTKSIEDIISPDAKIAPAVVGALEKRCNGDEQLKKFLFAQYKINSFADLTNKQVSTLNKHWDEAVAKSKAVTE